MAKFWRILVRIDDVTHSGHLLVVVPAWNPNFGLFIPFDDVPEEVLESVDELPKRLFAEANLSAEDADELKIRNWEVPEDWSDILVDNAHIHEGGRIWCHMMCADEERLHQFATDKLGLKRIWYQGDHYDITSSKRIMALEMGATEVDSQTLVELRRRLRDG